MCGTSLCDIEMCTNIMLKNNGTLTARYKWWFEVDETGGVSFNPPQDYSKNDKISKSSLKSKISLKTIKSDGHGDSINARETVLENIEELSRQGTALSDDLSALSGTNQNPSTMSIPGHNTISHLL